MRSPKTHFAAAKQMIVVMTFMEKRMFCGGTPAAGPKVIERTDYIQL